jgi:hypothetical protein
MRLLLVLAAVGCGGGQTPIEVVTVSALRAPCQAFTAELCLVMQPDFEPPETLFFGIDGYTHRWGIESELKIRREQVDPPLPDGPSERIILLETIIEREPIIAPFQLSFPFNGNRWFQGSAASGTLDLLGTTVLCEASVCSEIVTADTNGFANFNVTFELTDDDQTLTAVSVP